MTKKIMIGFGALATLVIAVFVSRGDVELPGTGGLTDRVDPEVESMRLYTEYNDMY